jgi:hypothetical protein
MMTISAAHTVVTSRAVTRRFGADLFSFFTYAVTATRFVEPSDEDRAAVGQMFADYHTEPEPDGDTLAGEAAYLDAVSSLTPPLGYCKSCGRPAEVNADGWCDDCDNAIAKFTDSRY